MLRGVYKDSLILSCKKSPCVHPESCPNLEPNQIQAGRADPQWQRVVSELAVIRPESQGSLGATVLLLLRCHSGRHPSQSRLRLLVSMGRVERLDIRGSGYPARGSENANNAGTADCRVAD